MPLQRTFSRRLPRALDGRMAVVRLFDAYAALLTERQRVMVRMYYHDDLSLGEIASRFDVTRQAVFDSLRRSVNELGSIEDRLGLLAARDRQSRVREALAARLADVEEHLAGLADPGGVDLAGLRSALRALRDAL
ncbi:MAG TPA: sigma factor-like helix-turn-helix DNA-binding protein [bacterium]|nr:sigma factor-like helix-turn-helix DNA-binding protein [bacterium]